MKRIVLFWGLVVYGMALMADPVDPSMARKVASNFLTAVSKEGREMAQRGLVQRPMMSEFPDVYLFTNYDGSGFVLVSADDRAYPILGYSCESRFEMEGMPVHVHDFLKNYQDQISYLRNSVGRYLPPTVGLWRSLLEENTFSLPLSTSVSPLLSTTWSQAPYYNAICPYYASGERSVTGCVATATAQVMKYWNWPNTGIGSHSYVSCNATQSADFGATTYNWANMPARLDSYSTSTQVNAVATLMYHVGVAVEMKYGELSGAQSASFGDRSKACVENALVDYFKYKSSLVGIYRDSYTDEQWCEILRNELDSNRPIIYAGQGVGGGHCFVLDGYDAAGGFHINWGWDGSCDGYYVIGDLNPTSGGTGTNRSNSYNDENQAIIGVEPNLSTSSSSTIIAQSNNTALGTVSGGGTFSLGHTVSLEARAREGCRFARWSDGSIYNPREIVTDGNNMTLTAVFESLQGDTLGYTSGVFKGRMSGYESGTKWGIRIPASVLTPGHDLYQVQSFFYYTGSYELRVYVGSSPTDANLVHSQLVVNPALDQWSTIDLSSPVAVDGSSPIWIMFATQDVSYPYCQGFWSGNSDGQYFMPYASTTLRTAGNNSSALLRGIFSATQPEGYCAQPIDVVVGDSSSILSELRVPFDFRTSSAVTEMIVDEAELGVPMTINSLSFYLNSDYLLDRDFSIYIQPTSRNSFGSYLDMEPFSPERGVLVYSGEMEINPGWFTINFSQPYIYNGSGNLMVIVVDNSGYYYNSNAFSFKVSNTAISKTVSCSGLYNYSANSLPPTRYGNSFCTQNRPVMKLLGCGAPHESVCPQYHVTLQTNGHGSCAGEGDYPIHSSVQIMAIPEPGHRFLRWNDGSTDNPRIIVVNQDTTLRAFFEW